MQEQCAQYNHSYTEIEFPGSTKSPNEPLRKKIFSSSKQFLKNNENVSAVNINTASSPLAESSKAYDQLKNKITNLEGRLVEIKKNFELSFHKRSDKSRIGKENSDTLREKQRSKLVINRCEDKPEKAKN